MTFLLLNTRFSSAIIYFSTYFNYTFWGNWSFINNSDYIKKTHSLPWVILSYRKYWSKNPFTHSAKTFYMLHCISAKIWVIPSLEIPHSIWLTCLIRNIKIDNFNNFFLFFLLLLFIKLFFMSCNFNWNCFMMQSIHLTTCWTIRQYTMWSVYCESS